MSSLAVLAAITIMGGFFSVGGMIIGVPVFAVIIELVKRAIEDKLRGKGKETDTTHYYRKGAIGNAEEEVYYEHAHWKYKYDHSRIKPYVDRLLTAIGRLFKKMFPDDSADKKRMTEDVYYGDASYGDTPDGEIKTDSGSEEAAEGTSAEQASEPTDTDTADGEK